MSAFDDLIVYFGLGCLGTLAITLVSLIVFGAIRYYLGHREIKAWLARLKAESVRQRIAQANKEHPVTNPFMMLGCTCGANKNTLAITEKQNGSKVVVCPCGKSGLNGQTEIAAIGNWNTAPWRLQEKMP